MDFGSRAAIQLEARWLGFAFEETSLKGKQQGEFGTGASGISEPV